MTTYFKGTPIFLLKGTEIETEDDLPEALEDCFEPMDEVTNKIEVSEFVPIGNGEDKGIWEGD